MVSITCRQIFAPKLHPKTPQKQRDFRAKPHFWRKRHTVFAEKPHQNDAIWPGLSDRSPEGKTGFLTARIPFPSSSPASASCAGTSSGKEETQTAAIPAA